jgi:hypothetical protein
VSGTLRIAGDHRDLQPDIGDHLEWSASGGDETEALATLIGEMSQAGASREALNFVTAAYHARVARSTLPLREWRVGSESSSPAVGLSPRLASGVSPADAWVRSS